MGHCARKREKDPIFGWKAPKAAVQKRTKINRRSFTVFSDGFRRQKYINALDGVFY